MALSDTPNISVTAVTYKAKQCALNMRIPEENLRVDSFRDYMRDDLLIQVGIMMAGVQDKTQTVTNTKILGFLPSTFRDWVSKHISIWLNQHKLYKLAGCFPHRETAVTTNSITEHWNVCPHTPIHDRRDGCLSFMKLGSDFPMACKEAQVAAQKIVDAVIADVDRPYALYPSITLMRAIRDYKEATGCR